MNKNAAILISTELLSAAEELHGNSTPPMPQSPRDRQVRIGARAILELLALDAQNGVPAPETQEPVDG